MKKWSTATIVFILLLGWNGFICLFGILGKSLHSPIGDLLMRIGGFSFLAVLIVFILLKWVFKVIK